ncbi:MAG: diaminopimelate dehydrogenase [Coriobacteriales bacterium]|nr:diaminopimelate dehydrogenase [Coriobacteriales bacterium]
MNKISIAIFGYGNLGKGVELAILDSDDLILQGIYTRRDPSLVKCQSNVKVYCADEIYNNKDKIDVVIICGGSATDLPVQSPKLAKDFNIVDSFDTHANIPKHFDTIDEISKLSNTTATISCGWDPGLFSLARIYSCAILNNPNIYTFWGRGVSQGHSDAIRRIDGVADARQYTIPIENALNDVKAGKNPVLTDGEKHMRECFVVAKKGADLTKIENEIVNMPNYFAPYKTIVHFISQEELDTNHKGLPHGGSVISIGKTAGDNTQVIDFSLELDSNPQFTGCVLASVARATYKMAQEGKFGCKTMFDIPPAYLCALSPQDLRKNLL